MDELSESPHERPQSVLVHVTDGFIEHAALMEEVRDTTRLVAPRECSIPNLCPALPSR